MTDKERRPMFDDVPEWFKRRTRVQKTLILALWWTLFSVFIAKAFYDNMGGGG